jgi:hypothetical protein
MDCKADAAVVGLPGKVSKPTVTMECSIKFQNPSPAITSHSMIFKKDIQNGVFELSKIAIGLENIGSFLKYA